MVRTKIYAGITIIAVVGVLSMLYVYHGLTGVAGHLSNLSEVKAPFSIAAIEMEKNAGEYASGVLRYDANPLPEIRTEAHHDRTDFARYYANYTRTAVNAEAVALGHHLNRDFQKLVTVGEALMNQRDRLDATFDNVTGLLEDIDVVIDDHMMQTLPTREPARSRHLAAISNMEAEAAEIGFWLSVFEHRQTPDTRQRVYDKIDELKEALDTYRQLELTSTQQALAKHVQALYGQIGDGIHKVVADKDNRAKLINRLQRLEEHIDAISDDKIQPIAALGLTRPQQEANVLTQRVLTTLGYVIPVYFLIALIVAALLTVAVIHPLKRLARGVRAIGTGNLAHRVAQKRKDEFGELAWQFNDMMDRLQETTVSRQRLEDSEKHLQRTVAMLRKEIAERRHAQHEQEKLQARLQRTEAMAAVGRLMGGVAHEARNPLFGISSTLDAMDAAATAGITDNDERSRAILRREVNRLGKLMSDLLEYGKPVTCERRDGRLADVVGEAVRVCRPVAESAKVSIVNQTAHDSATVSMSYDRLLQVFVNLVENAVQHSPANGTVVIATTAGHDTDGKAFVDCQVSDTGEGFTGDDLERLFEPFYSRRRGGTGLGLAIVQRIVDEHDGDITAANGADGGAVMTVRLPLSSTPTA